MAEIQFDAISWTRVVNNDIMPLLPPKPFNYSAPGDTRFGTVYGHDNQYTGTLSADAPPSTPTLAVEDLGGGVARVTITGASVGTTNRIYARPAGDALWPVLPAATIAENGTADATLTPGAFLGKVQSALGFATSPAANEPVIFNLVDVAAGYDRSEFGELFVADALPQFFEAFGEAIGYRRGVQFVEVTGIQGEAVTANDSNTGVDVVIGDASWEISADELDFGSGPIVPKAQDQISTKKGEIYVVVEAGVLDAEQLIWTVPVKRSEYKEL